MLPEVLGHKSSIVPESTGRGPKRWKPEMWPWCGGWVSPSWVLPWPFPFPLMSDEGCWSLCWVSAVALEVTKEFMKLRRILKSGTVKMCVHAVSHTALIWIWSLKCWLASGPWSCEGERSHLKWLLPKALQFSVILTLENTLLTFRIQALTSVKLAFLSALFLKHFTRG